MLVFSLLEFVENKNNNNNNNKKAKKNSEKKVILYVYLCVSVFTAGSINS